MQLSPAPKPNPAPRLIYTYGSLAHSGFFHYHCSAQDEATGYPVVDRFSAVVDDFGTLQRLPGEHGVFASLYAHNADTHFDIDDEAHALIWPDYIPPKPPAAVEVSIEPTERHDWIAAEIRVRQNVEHDRTEKLYLLAIGGQDTVYASTRELQGLASACADVLGLRLVANKRRRAGLATAARAAA